MRADRYKAEKKIRNKKIKKISFSVISILLIGLIGYFTYFALATNQVLNDIQGEPLTATETNPRSVPVKLKNKDSFSVLLLGVDERLEDSGRSDSMLVATVNPKLGNVKLISIPRDTLVSISSKGKDKINAAYAYGGITLAVKTIEEFLDIPINYYAKINMEGLIDLVDAVNGIEVNNKYSFELEGISIDKGTQTIDGTKALQYARMRKQDPAGDFGRQERQKEVIQKVVEKGLSITSLTNFNSIFQAVGKNVETNFTGSELWDLLNNYSSVAKNIETLNLEGKDSYLYYIPSYGQEVYVWEPTNESLSSIQQELQLHLNLETTNGEVDSSSDEAVDSSSSEITNDNSNQIDSTEKEYNPN
ncbi:LCP family glycopolymer transferase [Carnobacterium divergens]|uniref:Transcription regulator n=1 Tax=Carnobacterium divergens DSM 20623 TaxID=1449336 RepID=A0A0R2I621_CARDV|nr:LCP family protein [Carnobacterium divergens]KRN57162.1 transcription regulator [Carnobacterium divergens DSM 20623]MDO0875619.1 LCP family protein [Carnobacterium divergens]SUX16621.1 Membrane-bound protein lytR [Carnobacterium divergens]